MSRFTKLFHSFTTTASVASPKINQTNFKTDTSLVMNWSPDFNIESDFNVVGYNVTLATAQQKTLYQWIHQRIDNQALFIDSLHPYNIYKLAVSAYNRLRIYSPPAEYFFTTDEAGIISRCSVELELSSI